MPVLPQLLAHPTSSNMEVDVWLAALSELSALDPSVRGAAPQILTIPVRFASFRAPAESELPMLASLLVLLELGTTMACAHDHPISFININHYYYPNSIKVFGYVVVYIIS